MQKEKYGFIFGKEASQIEILNIENTPTQHIIPFVLSLKCNIKDSINSPVIYSGHMENRRHYVKKKFTFI